MADKKNKEPEKNLTPEQIYAKAEILLAADPLIVEKAYRVDNFKTAAKYFNSLGDFEDAPARAEECLKMAEEAKNEYLTSCYNEGQELLQSAKTPGDYEDAWRAFSKIPGYKDADELAKQCSEKKEQKEYSTWKKRRLSISAIVFVVLAAIIIFATPLRDVIFGTSGSKFSFAKAEDTKGYVPLDEAMPGDLVSFGEIKDYDWRVLEKDGDELLLLMSHAEKHMETRNGAYNDKLADVTWADCSLRKWLNGQFLQEEFTDEERAMIVLQKCENPDNQTYGTDGGEDTEDYVTLLTPEMYEKHSDITGIIAMNFWLRAPGATQQAAEFVSHRQNIMDYGYAVNSDDFYVVPVIKINTAA